MPYVHCIVFHIHTHTPSSRKSRNNRAQHADRVHARISIASNCNRSACTCQHNHVIGDGISNEWRPSRSTASCSTNAPTDVVINALCLFINTSAYTRNGPSRVPSDRLTVGHSATNKCCGGILINSTQLIVIVCASVAGNIRATYFQAAV